MRIGITGHQRLAEDLAWSWVAQAMGNELDKLGGDLTAVTSLAIGADQLLARLVLERGGRIHAVLPYADLERSFSHDDLPAYQNLRARAEVEILSTPGSDEDAYLAAGKRVADSSDVLFAVWNGKPAEGKGGTGDIVEYARHGGTEVVHFNPVDRTVQRSKSR